MTPHPDCAVCAQMTPAQFTATVTMGRRDLLAWGTANNVRMTVHTARDHRKHINAEARDAQPAQAGLFDEPDVLTGHDAAVDAATETTAAWMAAHDLETPPGFQAATIEVKDGQVVRAWHRVKPEGAAQLSDAEVTGLRNRVHGWTRTPRVTRTRSTQPGATLFVALSDWQLGKGEGGGVKATVDRITASLDATANRVEELRSAGRNIERIAVVNMGDPTEGCEGNYAQQLFTTELNLRDQLTLALDLWLTHIRTLAPLAPGFTFASVLCNHGELSRRGGKSVTDNADNAGGLLADTTRRVLDGRRDFAHIDWHVPSDEMVSLVDLSGVPVGLTHGHTIKGREDAWLNAQSIRLLREHGREPKLWVTAHRHHLNVTDFGPFFRLQCPSQDGGSRWFEDSAGKWSTPGCLTFLVGKHDPRGFSDLQVV